MLRQRRILVINGKGGCGKTTIATNLAVAYAAKGRTVALIDQDGQGLSAYWAGLRPSRLPKVRALQTNGCRCRIDDLAPRNVERIIVDGHAGDSYGELRSLVQQADVILVPIMPSAIDIQVGGRFITELLTHRRFRATPRSVGVLANRVQPNGDNHAKLARFLGCLGHPVVATLRDSPVYSDAFSAGRGVVDMRDNRAARKETPAWRDITAWVDAQPAPVSSFRRYARRPLAANSRYTGRRFVPAASSGAVGR